MYNFSGSSMCCAAQTFLQGSSEVLPWVYSFCGDFRLEFLCSWNAILPPSNIRGIDIKLATPATTKPKQLVPLLPRYFQLHSKIQSMLAGIWEMNKEYCQCKYSATSQKWSYFYKCALCKILPWEYEFVVQFLIYCTLGDANFKCTFWTLNSNKS